ncbi:MAG: hypothetical protein ACOX4M_02780 [Acetivibrionales bacterium]
MLNILHLINHLGRGGSEKYICLLAKKLHNRLCRFYPRIRRKAAEGSFSKKRD